MSAAEVVENPSVSCARPESLPPIAPASAERFAALDAARGFAMVLMTLDHAAALSRVSLLAERYRGWVGDLAPWPFWLLGLVTNIAAPLFWAVSGVSVAFLARSLRARTGDERALTGFLIIRGAMLLLLDVLVVSFLWAPTLHFKTTYTFDLLSSISLSLVLLGALRLLPRPLFALTMLGLLVGFQAFSNAIPTALRDGPWLSIWMDYVGGNRPAVSFPVLGWVGLMGMGYLVSDWIMEPAWRMPRRWLLVGAAFLAAGVALRVSGAYGDFEAWNPSRGALDFFVMSKGPPGLCYLAFNLGLGCWVFALLLALGPRLSQRPWIWMVDLGRASLFIYVTHLVLFKVLAWMAYRVPGHVAGVRQMVTWIPGLVILIPLARWYRRLKQRHYAVLKYL